MNVSVTEKKMREAKNITRKQLQLTTKGVKQSPKSVGSTFHIKKIQQASTHQSIIFS